MVMFSLLQSTSRVVQGHVVGADDSSVDPDGRGQVHLSVGQGDAVDRLTVAEGQCVSLSDGWTIRLSGVRYLPAGISRAAFSIELMPPGENACPTCDPSQMGSPSR
jgi:hypothetical protein